MSFDSLLNRTCTIQEKENTFSATGSPTKTWSDKETNAKCAIQTISGEDGSQEQYEKLNVTHFAFFKTAADIVAGNRIISDSVNYTVKRVDDAAGRDHHKEVLLELKAN